MSLDDFTESAPLPPLSTIDLDQIADEYPKVISDLKNWEPLKTASAFAALLLVPALQANCLRLEVLVHLALAHCEGRRAPPIACILRNFERLGEGSCCFAEDPSEDLFVSLVHTNGGSFRIFEGLREGNSFHLQRILNIVERMPSQGPFAAIRDSVTALLMLTDAVAGRAGIKEYILGSELPLNSCPKEVAKQLAKIQSWLTFERGDLERMHTPLESLTPFVLDQGRFPGLADGVLGATDLERYPLVQQGERVHFILPTATGSALIRFVVESVVSVRKGDTFEVELAREYSQLFSKTPILGDSLGSSLRFQQMCSGNLGTVAREVDSGRYLYFIFFIDGLNGFFPEGLAGENSDPEGLGSLISHHFEHLVNLRESSQAFVDGRCIFVGCGFGRALCFGEHTAVPEGWSFDVVSANDLVTLSWVSDFEPISVWRLLDAEKAIAKQGVDLLNVNGLLNLVAWSRELGGHLVPHGQLDDGLLEASRRVAIAIPTNSLRKLRYEVAKDWQPRRVLDCEGRWVSVRKLSHSLFKEDQRSPLYAGDEDAISGRLRGVYLSGVRPWWVEIITPEGASCESIYEHWKML